MPYSAGGFYSRGWFVPLYPIPDRNEWVIPLDGDYQHLKDTQNVEELEVFPELMYEDPEDIQAGGDQWITFISPTQEFYYVGSAFDTGYYLQIPGNVGFYLQSIGP